MLDINLEHNALINKKTNSPSSLMTKSREAKTAFVNIPYTERSCQSLFKTQTQVIGSLRVCRRIAAHYVNF